MKIRITKVYELDDAVHPNNIKEGYVKVVEMPDDLFVEPRIGYRFALSTFSTSVVTEIISDSLFKTLNSVYKWEKIC